jgi:polyisoprenoid-binding protein YceI
MNRDTFAAPVALAALLLLAPAAALAEPFEVNPDAGNSSFSAVFDAKLGERINAVSSAVGCQVAYDEKAGVASGTCSVPLDSIRVDNDDTKSDHFRQWATNKKSDPARCHLEAVFTNVKIGKLVAGTPTAPGTFGEKKTIQLRATVAVFDRDAYQIGPKYTDGWLARVQSLATVVAEKGVIDLSLFAKAK